jgi:hypothetical protein
LKQTHLGGRQNKNPKTTHPVVPTSWHVPIHLSTHLNVGMGTPYDKFKLLLKRRHVDIGVLNFFWDSPRGVMVAAVVPQP